MKRIYILFVLLTIISACATSPINATVNIQPIEKTTPLSSVGDESGTSATKPKYSLPSPCGLPPIAVPTLPAVIPGYTELDKTTGLHMTGKVQKIDLATYKLKISGLVDHPSEFNFEELRCFPKITVTTKLVCPGYFEDDSTWSGVPIVYLLEKVGVQKTATEAVLISADGYETHISLKDALNEHNFLAYEWMTQPVPIMHGFPVRAVFPLMNGSTWAKWLVEINIR